VTEERCAPTAAVLGGAAWSTLVHVPRLPRDLTTLQATATLERIGGPGAGKALHLARLGLRTRLHSLLGDDEPGSRVRSALTDAGVELTMWPDPAGTERQVILSDTRGDRLTISLSAATEEPGIDVDELCRFAAGADLVFTSLSPYVRRVLPRLAQDHDLWVDLQDWNGRPSDLHDPFVEHGTHVFVSDVDIDDPRETAAAVISSGAQLVVITHGRRGATAFFPDREPHFVLPYDAGAAVDANGARDAFIVGTAYGRLQGWDWGTALRAGAVVAGGSVTTPLLADPRLSTAWLAERLQAPD
jgi:sugar/nucleoside kinase (ribokinase family)